MCGDGLYGVCINPNHSPTIFSYVDLLQTAVQWSSI